jgi:hypothetical protein
MSLKSCLPGLVEDGKISQEQADHAAGLFDELAQDLRRQFGDQAADAMASDQTLKAMQTELTRRRFLAARTIEAHQQIALDLGFGGEGGGEGAAGSGGAVAARDALGLFKHEPGVAGRNVDGIRRAIERRAFAIMTDILQKFHTDALGRVRGVATQRDMVRELFGKDTGNPEAKALAQAWRDAAEMLRQRFNAAGGDIGKNEDWGLPQNHNTDKVRMAGFQTWRDFIKDKLDLDRMVDLRTGLKFTPQSLEGALREVYETIRSSGWYNRDPASLGHGSVANRRADARFLIFKDADAWLEYSDRFGDGEILHSMIGHVRGMARDTAAMDRFGPNPESGVKLAHGMVKKAAAMVDDGGQANRAARATMAGMDSLWSEYTGSNRIPASEWLANVGSAVRSFETAKNLGSAPISAIPADLMTTAVATKFNGLSFTKTLANIARQLNPLDPEARALANRMGLIYEGWIHHTATSARLFGDEVAAGKMGRVAEGVLRLSGLGAWTDPAHAGMAMTAIGHMADMRGRSFAELDRGFRGMLERQGMGPADWDAIRATPVQTIRGQDWLFPQDIADQRLGDRVIAMLGNEQDIAIPMHDFATRALANENLKRGTVMGEVAKSSLLFKSFGIGMLLNQTKRIVGISSWKGRAGYIAGLTTLMTLGGAATLQMREIAQGRDPRPMDPTTPAGQKFWLNALFQGSGFGIASDLLGLVVDPRIGNWAEYLAGPVASTVQNVAVTAAKGAQHAAFVAGLARQDVNAGGAFAKTLREEMPGGNLWYSRLALQRLFFDNVSSLADPNYLQARQRTANLARQNGSAYWWAPGDTMPGRAPDISNITAQPGQEPSP